MATGDILRLGGGTNFSTRDVFYAGGNIGTHLANPVLEIAGSGILHTIFKFSGTDVQRFCFQIDDGPIYTLNSSSIIVPMFWGFKKSLKVTTDNAILASSIKVLYSLD